MLVPGRAINRGSSDIDVWENFCQERQKSIHSPNLKERPSDFYIIISYFSTFLIEQVRSNKDASEGRDED